MLRLRKQPDVRAAATSRTADLEATRAGRETGDFLIAFLAPSVVVVVVGLLVRFPVAIEAHLVPALFGAVERALLGRGRAHRGSGHQLLEVVALAGRANGGRGGGEDQLL